MVYHPRHRQIHWADDPGVDAAGSPALPSTVLDRPSEAETVDNGSISDDLEPELPAWPVLCLFWGTPIWWVLGLFPFSGAVVAPVMLYYLLLRRSVWLAPGTLSYLALVGWMVTGFFVKEPGDEFSVTIRFVQYASVAVLIVYVVNARARLTTDRLLAALTALWWFVIAGGYLGLLMPYGRLTTTVGSLLPEGIASNQYAQQLLFPQFAEVQTPYGASVPFLRPAAPFYYANGWGAAMTLLIPVAVAFALRRGTTRAKFYTLVGVALTLPPAVTANNRGMFLALGVALCVVLIRTAAIGRWNFVVGYVMLAAGAVFTMLQLGLVESVLERAATGQSTEGRTRLYTETLQRTLDSPIVGYGAPRASFTTEVTVGTQGAVWTAMFCSGFVGLMLLLYFLFGAVRRTWHLRSPSGLWLNASLVATCVMSAYYGIDGMLVLLGAVSAMLLRDSALDSSRRTRAG